MARPPVGGFEGEGVGCVYYFCCGVLQVFPAFGTTKHHNPFDPPNKASGLDWSFSALLVTHEVYVCTRLLPKHGLPAAIVVPTLQVRPAARSVSAYRRRKSNDFSDVAAQPKTTAV